MLYRHRRYVCLFFCLFCSVSYVGGTGRVSRLWALNGWGDGGGDGDEPEFV